MGGGGVGGVGVLWGFRVGGVGERKGFVCDFYGLGRVKVFLGILRVSACLG